jgi:ABC-2 type transport system permease protein
MRTIILLVQKEFLQILRNRTMLPILIVMPVIQLIILSFAATHDIKNISLAVTDYDRSTSSRLLVSKLTASGYFKLKAMPLSDDAAFDLIENDKADLVLTIPNNFERDVLRKQPTKLQMQVNAINGQKAGLAASYAGQVFQNFSQEMMPVFQSASLAVRQSSTLSTTWSNWYNPTLDYKTFMVPGILGELVAMLVLVLSAMNVVREKEVGTIEQINVSPIRKWQFIAGKLLPFLFIGLFDLTLGLTVGKLVFDIPMVGSLWVVFAFCVVNIFAVLGIGFFISNFADTQQQAMFIAWFFMVIFILMSGLFTPIESMPEWAQAMTVPNPIAHFVEVMRLVLLKGSGFDDIRYNFLVCIIIGVVMNGLAMLTYRKRVG